MRLAIALVLAGVVLGVYWPVLGFDFVGYDDTLYVTRNPYVPRRSDRTRRIAGSSSTTRIVAHSAEGVSGARPRASRFTSAPPPTVPRRPTTRVTAQR